jgi:lipopolysaccharide transport system ATP-binding protein
MPAPIIKVENLSKSFTIFHEGKERYVSLRDVLTQQARKVFYSTPSKIQNRSSEEEFWALKDVNFEIQQGDRVGIIGRNGAGKSTLLKVLSRITDPTKGRVEINGRVASLLEVGTGFHPELTGRENIFLNGAILGMSRTEIRAKFDEIVAFAEVEQFLDTPVKRYSSGMYVRLAFAVAAHLEPEILIVDEVLAVGDAQFQKKCLGKMQDVSKNEGRTVLFVSHNMGVIAQLCNKGILLNKGIVEAQGEIDAIVNRYISGNAMADGIYLFENTLPTHKKNYFLRISTSDTSGKLDANFAFNEQVKISFDFIVSETIPNLNIGIVMINKLQQKVFTLVKPIDFFRRDGEKYSGSVELPASIVAPNGYSFNFIIWIKDVIVYDFIENVCPIQIHDNGTEFAIYDGYDYGSVILNVNWN